MLVCQKPSFYLKRKVKKGHDSKTIGFRGMPLVLQLHLVMMSKYSKFGVDIFNTSCVKGYISFCMTKTTMIKRSQKLDFFFKTD